MARIIRTVDKIESFLKVIRRELIINRSKADKVHAIAVAVNDEFDIKYREALDVMCSVMVEVEAGKETSERSERAIAFKVAAWIGGRS